MQEELKTPYLLSRIILNALKILSATAFILCAALNLRANAINALILVECGHIAYRLIDTIFFIGDSFWEKVKRFVKLIAPGAIVTVILAMVSTYVDDPSINDIVIIATWAATVIFMFLLVVPVSSYDRHDDKFIMKTRVTSSLQRILYKLFGVLYRILIIAGFLLIMFAGSFAGSDIYYEGLVIAGSVITTFTKSSKK